MIRICCFIQVFSITKFYKNFLDKVVRCGIMSAWTITRSHSLTTRCDTEDTSMRMFEVVQANTQYAGSYIFKPIEGDNDRFDRSRHWESHPALTDESTVCSWEWTHRRPNCADGVWGSNSSS
jgi:hypothetical protein